MQSIQPFQRSSQSAARPKKRQERGHRAHGDTAIDFWGWPVLKSDGERKGVDLELRGDCSIWVGNGSGGGQGEVSAICAQFAALMALVSYSQGEGEEQDPHARKGIEAVVLCRKSFPLC